MFTRLEDAVLSMLTCLKAFYLIFIGAHSRQAMFVQAIRTAM